jgi:hypothetical protein
VGAQTRAGHDHAHRSAAVLRAAARLSMVDDIARIFRAENGRAVAVLTRFLGDL